MDIQNNYNEKNIIDIKDFLDCNGTLFLFNIIFKDYIVVSYNSEDKYSKLYDFQKNDSFIRNIYGTNKKELHLMIPWAYQDKFYLINIYLEKISINNLLEDECYAEIKIRGMKNYSHGSLDNNNFLYISANEHYIIILNLKTKNVVTKIDINSQKDSYLYKYSEIKRRIFDILLWNNSYGIICTEDNFLTMDLKEQKILEDFFPYNKVSIFEKSYNIKKIKKIKLDELKEECLLFMENGYLKLLKKLND